MGGAAAAATAAPAPSTSAPAQSAPAQSTPEQIPLTPEEQELAEATSWSKKALGLYKQAVAQLAKEKEEIGP